MHPSSVEPQARRAPQEDWGGFLDEIARLNQVPPNQSPIRSDNAKEDSPSSISKVSGDSNPPSEGESVIRPILGRGDGGKRADLTPLKDIVKSKLVETDEIDIEVLRSDPNNPLHSAKSFQEMNLKGPLLRGISAMGFYKPSAIQEKALTSIIGANPQNMIAQSQSGTGKTATFLMAMLSRVNPQHSYCQCLCMAPTRELALQIVAVGRRMATFMEGVSFGVAVRETQVSVGADGYVTNQIIVGTPGTVVQWARCTGSVRFDPFQLRVFVLDEADLMMEEEGFLNISQRIKRKLSPSCQILLFSATYGDDIVEFAREFVPNPIEIRVKRTELSLKNIKQYYLLFDDWTVKYQALTEIHGDFDIGEAIIFCATRQEASWLHGRMNMDGHRVVILSGDLELFERQQVLEQFRSAAYRVLITTNLCSRGLDIPQVNLVINWNMPVTRSGSADCETYLHRIGRSGRFGKEGMAVNFITTEEKHLIDELEAHFQIKIPLLTDQDRSLL
ncbi:ATP-dependent RNA helicase ddx25 [Clonorchis sinensis]|uniref:RNA helicase n=2 Tax=Clonorchis sinensis TaxID=79923 RepID=A0A8T1MRP4_CLOSI|nr:ATP-dependent RNA helicase ddx25 [Clonorchis sinensis]